VPSRVISQKVAVSVVYAGAMFIAVMDQTIVNVALAAIGRQFHTSATAVAGTVIGYQVSVALFIPAAAWLGDRIGPRQVLLGSIALFTVASALCGLAGSLDELVAFRVLQGAGGGLMTPVGLTMLFRAFPQAERVRASAILVIPTALAPAVGPVIGGLFVTGASWRWVFYVNVPVGVLALVFGVLFLANQDHPAAGRFDVAGFITSSLGLGLLMYGVSEGPNVGWTAGPTVACIASGALLLATMVVIELRATAPLLDLRVYADGLFRSASLVLTLTSVAFFGLIFLLSLFFQDGLHFSALQAGSTICPEAFGVIIASQFISRRLYPAVGPRRIMVAGLLLIAGISALHPVRTVAGQAEANLSAFRDGLLVCAGVAVAAALAALSVRDADAAPTMLRHRRQSPADAAPGTAETVIPADS
jgi:EmrB/QacA subfamily drug resistance transporter